MAAVRRLHHIVHPQKTTNIVSLSKRSTNSQPSYKKLFSESSGTDDNTSHSPTSLSFECDGTDSVSVGRLVVTSECILF